jgi:hypothetical protein
VGAGELRHRDALSRWEAVLGDRPNVTVRVYPEDDHLFTPGSGPSTPAEYEPAQHVDATVIAHIAAWLATVPGQTYRTRRAVSATATMLERIGRPSRS